MRITLRYRKHGLYEFIKDVEVVKIKLKEGMNLR